MKCGVILYPGSNCDDDMMHVVGDVFRQNVQKIWHKETSLDSFDENDVIFVPGGFSYGDYLRAGAIARFSPIMKSVVKFANNGGTVIGICNGFQVLCEAGLLPGALLRNKNQRFISKNSYLKVENTDTVLTRRMEESQVIRIPIAHAEGRYYAPDEVLKEIEENNQVLFRYCMASGEITEEANVNGSINNIAGIMNVEKNVFGMMPHPERAAESLIGNTDGRVIFESLFDIKEKIVH